MVFTDKELLKTRVKEFLSNKPFYNPLQHIRVVCDDGIYFIVYGDDVTTGVIAFGETPDGAFNSFMDNWKTYCDIKTAEKKNK